MCKLAIDNRSRNLQTENIFKMAACMVLFKAVMMTIANVIICERKQ